MFSLDDSAALRAGGKAGALARARRAGLPVLPGYVVRLSGCRSRREVFATEPDPAPLRHAVAELGGRVIVRSACALEEDGRWAGAFTSIADVRSGDVPRAVRSCWASAFAPAALRRAEACGVPVETLADFAVLIQPQLDPGFGGVARDGRVEGVPGSPAPLLSGWVPSAPLPPAVRSAAARLSRAVPGALIEWAHAHGRVHLLQISHNGRAAPQAIEPASAHPVLGPPGALGGGALGGGAERRVPARVLVAGDAVGVLTHCRPHERVPDGRILLADRPLRAFAPLLFGARGLVLRRGPDGSHLAEVARSTGVPTMIAAALDPSEDGRTIVMDSARGEIVLVGRPSPTRRDSRSG